LISAPTRNLRPRLEQIGCETSGTAGPESQRGTVDAIPENVWDDAGWMGGVVRASPRDAARKSAVLRLGRDRDRQPRGQV